MDLPERQPDVMDEAVKMRLEKVSAFIRHASMDIINSNKELRKILNKRVKELEPTVKQYEGKVDGSYMPYRQALEEMSAAKDKLLEIDAQDADLTQLLARPASMGSAVSKVSPVSE